MKWPNLFGIFKKKEEPKKNPNVSHPITKKDFSPSYEVLHPMITIEEVKYLVGRLTEKYKVLASIHGIKFEEDLRISEPYVMNKEDASKYIPVIDVVESDTPDGITMKIIGSYYENGRARILDEYRVWIGIGMQRPLSPDEDLDEYIRENMLNERMHMANWG